MTWVENIRSQTCGDFICSLVLGSELGLLTCQVQCSSTKLKPSAPTFCIHFLFKISYFEKGITGITSNDLELLILLFPHPECWHHRCAPATPSLHFYVCTHINRCRCTSVEVRGQHRSQSSGAFHLLFETGSFTDP